MFNWRQLLNVFYKRGLNIIFSLFLYATSVTVKEQFWSVNVIYFSSFENPKDSSLSSAIKNVNSLEISKEEMDTI